MRTDPDSKRADLTQVIDQGVSAVKLPAGVCECEQIGRELQRLSETLRPAIEQVLTPDECTLFVEATGGLRFAGQLLSGIDRRSWSAESRQVSSTPVLSPSSKLNRGLLIGVLKAGLAIGILVCLFASSLPAAISGLLFLAYLVAEIAGQRPSSAPPVANQNADAQSPSTAIEIAGDQVMRGVKDMLSGGVSACCKYSTAMAEVAELRSRRNAAAGSCSDGLIVFQRLLGAARRSPPALAYMVETEAINAITGRQHRAEWFRDEADADRYFDIQLDMEGQLTSPLTLYPAIVRNEDGVIVLLGRAIVPM